MIDRLELERSISVGCTVFWIFVTLLFYFSISHFVRCSLEISGHEQLSKSLLGPAHHNHGRVKNKKKCITDVKISTNPASKTSCQSYDGRVRIVCPLHYS